MFSFVKNKQSSFPVIHQCFSVHTDLQQTRLSRLKILHDACISLGYNITIPQSYSGKHIILPRRYLLIDTSNKVALNSVPKTGSTTWRFSLRNNSRSSSAQEYKWSTKGKKLPLIHKSGAFKNSSIIPAIKMNQSKILTSLKTYYTILTVRHPFDRLESAYMDKIVVTNMDNKLRQAILKKRRITADRVKKLARDGKSVTFEEFLQYVMSVQNDHWTSIFQLTRPCSLRYRY